MDPEQITPELKKRYAAPFLPTTVVLTNNVCKALYWVHLWHMGLWKSRRA